MSFLRKPFRKLKDFNPNSSGNGSSDSKGDAGTAGSPRHSLSKLRFGESAEHANGTTSPDPHRRTRDLIQEERQRRSIDKERLKAEQKKRQQLARIESDNFMKEGPQDVTNLYRPFSMNMSKRWNHENRQLFKDLDFASQ
jgi:ergosteryl-3beta-O-L-aspartate synthase